MTALFDALRAVVISSFAGGVAGLLLWGLFRCVKRVASAVQYYLWLTALVLCVIPLQFMWQPTATTPVMPLEQVTMRIMQTAHTPLPPPVTEGVPQVAWGDVFAGIWLVVAAVLFIGYLLKHIAAIRLLRRTTVETECVLLREFTVRRVQVRMGETVKSPMLVGVFRPTLYLPCRALGDEQLRHVLAHETVHLHRGDLLVKPLALLVRCVCWFNPLVYGMYRRFAAMCEISCDVAAVKKTGGDAASYLSTVLYLMCGGRGMPDRLTTAMAGNAHRVKERFLAVRDIRSHRVVTAVSAVAAVALLTGALCVGGMAAGRERVAPTFPTITQPLFSTPVTGEIAPVEDDGLRWPLCEGGAVTSSYGYRWGTFHRGVDIGGTVGDVVCAAAAGKVIATEEQGYNGGYGRMVMIDHGDGMFTLYGHLESINVAAGTVVSAGQRIGTLGMSGNVSGPCLHFEVQVDGEAVDPFSYLVNVEKEAVGHEA